MTMMKKIIMGLSALLLVLSGCTKESVVGQDEGQNVVISLATGTRSGSTDEGSVEDRYINSLRILGYRTSNGTLAFNVPVYGLPSTPESGKLAYSGTVNVKTGKFTIVLIANEHSDAAASTLLGGITTTANNTLTYLYENVTFSHTAFAADKDIPMVTVRENIVIQDNNKLFDPTKGSEALSEWPVSMERLGVRIDLKLAFNNNEDARTAWEADKKVTFSKVPDRVYLVAGKDNSAGTTSKVFTYSSATCTGTTTKTYDLGRIILPESYFTSATPEDKAMELSITADRERSCKVKSPISGHGYTLPRNTYLSATATVSADPETSLTLQTSALDWADKDMDHELQ